MDRNPFYYGLQKLLGNVTVDSILAHYSYKNECHKNYEVSFPAEMRRYV
jgi:hypothetical protein